MTITIIGATGFLGQKLIRHLLSYTSYDIVAFSRSAHKLPIEDSRLTKQDGSIFEVNEVSRAISGSDAAVYLFHMMGAKGIDFAAGEAEAAKRFVKSAATADLRRTVFMGGLGDANDPSLSKHLASRHETGRILREGLPSAIELRASMISAPGSVGFDIIRTMADKLPIIVIPRWAVTPTQPISIGDTLSYITAAIGLPPDTTSQIVEIGGPERLTYRDIAVRYATQTADKRDWNRRQPVFTIPGIPRWAAVWWLHRFAASKAGDIGGPMVDSLRNEMTVHDSKTAGRLFPDIRPSPISF